MIAMVLFGLGEVLGCFFIGYIIDKFGSRKSVFVNIVIFIVMIFFTFAFLYQYEYNYFTFLMTFMWGFADSAINTHT